MKKSLVLLAGASMAFLGLPAVSHAQAASGPFADVPTDHWAYQSVDTLQKAGIVIGYPDGTYGGRRPMTRYEFAVAIARLLAQMNKPAVSASDLAALRSDLENRIAGNTQAIDALRDLVNGFKPELDRLGVDVAANTARLDALEARVNALSGRLDRDEGILGSVVDEQRRFKVTGEVNLIARGDASRRTANGSSTATVPFLDENGVYVGGGGAGKRLLASSDIYHDVLLHIRGKIADTTTANVDLDFGNYLSQVGNTAAFPGYSAGGAAASALTPGSLTANNQYANVYKAYLDAAVKLGPLGGAELLVGRFGNQYTKYTLKQADADIYTNLTQTDSGDIIGDGASLTFKAGPAHINGFAFKNSAVQFSELYGGTTSSATIIPGTPAIRLRAPGGTTFATQSRPGGLIASNHVARYDEGVGGRVTFGAPEGAVLGATIEQFGLTNAVGGTTSSGVALGPFDGVTDPNRSGSNAQYNRVSVLGVDFNGALPFGLPGVKKGGFLVDASYTASGRAYGTKFNNVANGFRYQALDTQGGFALGGLNLKGGYQYVGPDFSAPGAWGRIGAWSNPTNVRGPVVSAKYAFTPKLSLDADAEFYKAAYGSDKLGNPVDNPLRQDDHVTHYQVGFKYGLSGANAIDLGYENVRYDLRNNAGSAVTGLTSAGHPTESYVNIGLGHTVSNNASVKLLYQIVHYDDKGTGFDPECGGLRRQVGRRHRGRPVPVEVLTRRPPPPPLRGDPSPASGRGVGKGINPRSKRFGGFLLAENSPGLERPGYSRLRRTKPLILIKPSGLKKGRCQIISSPEGASRTCSLALQCWARLSGQFTAQPP